MEKRSRILTFFILATAFCFFNSSVIEGSSIRKSKKDLEKIQQQINERKKDLEKYKKQEKEISNAIVSLKKKDSADKKSIKGLEKELRTAQSRKSDLRRKYEALQIAASQWVSILAGETAEYIWREELKSAYYGTRDLFADMFMRQALFRKYALLTQLKGESLIKLEAAGRWDNAVRRLSSKTSRIETRLLRRRGARSKKVTALARTRQEYRQNLKEVEKLKNSAIALARLIRKLKNRSPYRRGPKAKGIPLAEHSLPWPVSGRIKSSFGREAVPGLNTWLMREGIRIETGRGSAVRCVFGGEVIYSASFRSYGNVVIIGHKGGFFTVYGLLQSIAVKNGQRVKARHIIGTAGLDTQEGVHTTKRRDSPANPGALYFEIRSGEDAVNPVKWLKRR